MMLTPSVTPTPPRGKRSAIGGPNSTNTRHAKESANFLWISTARLSSDSRDCRSCWVAANSDPVLSSELLGDKSGVVAAGGIAAGGMGVAGLASALFRESTAVNGTDLLSGMTYASPVATPGGRGLA